MIKILKNIFFIVLSLFIIPAFSNPVDSLKNIIQNTSDDSVKIMKYLEIADYFYPGDKEYSKNITIAYNIAKKNNDDFMLAIASFYKAAEMNFYSKYDSAIILLDTSIKIFEKYNDTLYLARTWGEKGNSFCYQAIYDKCLDCFLKTLEFTEALDNLHFTAMVLNNIGNVYYFLDKPQKALEYFKKSYKTYIIDESPYGIALSTNNIGSVFLDNESLDSAQYYLLIAEKTADSINYVEQLAETYANLAKLFSLKREYKKGEEYSLKSIKLNRKIGSFHGLAKTFWAYGVILFEQNRLSKSRKYLDSALIVSKKAGVKEYEKNAFKWLFKVDSALGNYQQALENYIKYNNLSDSLKSVDVEKKIADLQSNFDLKIKEKQYALLEEKHAKQKQRQRLISIFTSIGVVLLLAIIGLLYNVSRQRKRYNKQLEEKNAEITQQKEEIITQNDDLISKNHEIIRQKEILQIYKQETSASINYAQRIQLANLPNIEAIKSSFSDVMLIYIPRDVISGDFYFYSKLNPHKRIIAVADCTGHGVPGALISILNIALLKEVIKDNQNFSAAEILQNVREKLKISLKQKWGTKSVNDGMDIGLFVFNSENNNINFAGANRPLYLFRNNKLKIIKYDRQPVGAYIREKDFKDNFLKLKKNDIIYLFSDGYIDQLSKEKKQKFLSVNFKNLLHKIHKFDFIKQKEILIDQYNNHKQNNRQTDDVTILGLKV